MANAVIATVVRKSDEDFAHSGPFAKMAVLVGIMKKASTSELIEWTVLCINDLFRNGMMHLGELSWDALTGYRSPGNKGTVDLLLYKKSMLQFFLEKFAAKHQFEGEFLTKLRDVMRDHITYRKQVEPDVASKACPDFVHPDISYRALWKRSGRLLASLVEETVYTRDHDGCLKVAIKARKVPEETVEYERFKDRITDILDALQEEKKKDKDEEQEAQKTLDEANAKSSEGAPGSGAAAKITITEPQADQWYKQAERMFISHCFLIAEPNSETALVTAIQATPVAGKRGTAGAQHILIHYDQKLSGEAGSRPALRQPPWSEEKYTKLMKSAIKARSGDEYVLLDCRGGLRQAVGIPHGRNFDLCFGLDGCPPLGNKSKWSMVDLMRKPSSWPELGMHNFPFAGR